MTCAEALRDSAKKFAAFAVLHRKGRDVYAPVEAVRRLGRLKKGDVMVMCRGAERPPNFCLYKGMQQKGRDTDSAYENPDSPLAKTPTIVIP